MSNQNGSFAASDISTQNYKYASQLSDGSFHELSFASYPSSLTGDEQNTPQYDVLCGGTSSSTPQNTYGTQNYATGVDPWSHHAALQEQSFSTAWRDSSQQMRAMQNFQTSRISDQGYIDHALPKACTSQASLYHHQKSTDGRQTHLESIFPAQADNSQAFTTHPHGDDDLLEPPSPYTGFFGITGSRGSDAASSISQSASPVVGCSMTGRDLNHNKDLSGDADADYTDLSGHKADLYCHEARCKSYVGSGGRAFANRQSLNKHRREFHTDNPPPRRHKCDFQFSNFGQCEKDFATYKDFLRHKLVHDTKGKWVCSLCDGDAVRPFKRKDNLRRHLKVQHKLSAEQA
ncbi:hypothetical protein EJ08DRAFT_694492 [Tothia fuscella]|uniref:C2H2-type domain-containing protein n=1 Tax=Tothia fuscella TaxID=1048955 RepID=A0A9P4NXM0_9PEZI|nr:hypothetical protein EJ08DRAFT_694492 [Tothia fuscella]